MSTLEEITDDIQRDLANLEKAVEASKRKPIELRRQDIPGLRNRTDKIKNLLQTFEFEIESQEGRNPNINQFKAEGRNFRVGLKKIEQQIDFLKSQGMRQEDLFKGAKTGTDNTLIDPNTRDKKELIQLGHRGQQQMSQGLDNALKDIHEMDEIGQNVQIELNKQIEQLDRIYDTVKDTETTMKRAQKYVRYFARQVYTDRCLMAMIILVILAIVVIIILSAVGIGKGAFNLPDQLK